MKLGVLSILASGYYLIYSIITRHRLNIYNKNKKIDETRKVFFLKLQLSIAVIISILNIILGIMIIKYNLQAYLISITPISIVCANKLLDISYKE